MNMTWLQSLIMGLVSGLSELLPISAEAHRNVLHFLFGIGSEDPIFRFVLHLSSLIVLIWSTRDVIYQLRRTNRLLKIPPKRRKAYPDPAAVCTIRLFRMASVLVVIGRLLTNQFLFIRNELSYLAAAFIFNGLILFVPNLLPSGNKDSRNMARIDGFLMGLAAAISVIPGFSLVGAAVAVGLIRGVDRKYALRFAYLLLIPGLVMDLIFDILAIAAAGNVVFAPAVLVIYLLGAAAAAIGSRIGVRLMGSLSEHGGFSGFSYYCWGAGLFCFTLFLLI